MKYVTVADTDFPARFKPGQIVLFSPDLNNFEDKRTHFPAKIVNVKFTPSKVLYDISLLCKELATSDNNFNPFYDNIPLENVDSIMVNEIDDILSEKGIIISKVSYPKQITFSVTSFTKMLQDLL
jgi:hypothetical protein